MATDVVGDGDGAGDGAGASDGDDDGDGVGVDAVAHVDAAAVDPDACGGWPAQVATRCARAKGV